MRYSSHQYRLTRVLLSNKPPLPPELYTFALVIQHKGHATKFHAQQHFPELLYNKRLYLQNLNVSHYSRLLAQYFQNQAMTEEFSVWLDVKQICKETNDESCRKLKINTSISRMKIVHSCKRHFLPENPLSLRLQF